MGNMKISALALLAVFLAQEGIAQLPVPAPVHSGEIHDSDGNPIKIEFTEKNTGVATVAVTMGDPSKTDKVEDGSDGDLAIKKIGTILMDVGEQALLIFKEKDGRIRIKFGGHTFSYEDDGKWYKLVPAGIRGPLPQPEGFEFNTSR